MKWTLLHLRLITLVAVGANGAAAAADTPKGERTTLPPAGQASLIPTHSAFSYEMTGTGRSASPAGMFDQTSFRCVGVSYAYDGKAGGTAVCEVLDRDGHKYLSHFEIRDGKAVRQQVTGTGKYEGMVVATTVQPLGPFPVVKPGTFQNCNRQSGTYKMK